MVRVPRLEPGNQIRGHSVPRTAWVLEFCNSLWSLGTRCEAAACYDSQGSSTFETVSMLRPYNVGFPWFHRPHGPFHREMPSCIGRIASLRRRTMILDGDSWPCAEHRTGRAATRRENIFPVLQACRGDRPVAPTEVSGILFLRNPEAVASGPPRTPPVVPRFESRVGF